MFVDLWFDKRQLRKHQTISERIISFFLCQLELLMAKQEEEKRRLEEQMRSAMDAQREQMQNMMRANMNELQREREEVSNQNKSMRDAMEGMQRSLNERNGQITNLQRQIQEIANRPPPAPPKRKKRCVVM